MYVVTLISHDVLNLFEDILTSEDIGEYPAVCRQRSRPETGSGRPETIRYRSLSQCHPRGASDTRFNILMARFMRV
jgi:hypothetical protein